MALDQLQRVDGVRIERRDHVDGKEHALAVRAQAELLRITLGVAQLVQNGIGLLGVVLRELGGQFLVVPGVAGPRAGLVRFGLT